MLIHPEFNPVAISLGPISIHWYGLTYLFAFLLFLFFSQFRIKHEPFATLVKENKWHKKYAEDILFYVVFGVILGGRLGFCLFYQPGFYLNNPLEILKIWRGGMSFHGGMLGVFVASWLFAYQRKISWLLITDFIAATVPLCLASGRIGNFINGELWGRVTHADIPWAMVFPTSGTLDARHPSQIYQFLMEGILLFLILWFYAKKGRKIGQVSSLFLIGYGIFRFIAEYFRQPDSYLGLLVFDLSMGQLLCLPMIIFGLILLFFTSKGNKNV